jgi:hypothetical protein
MQQTRTQQRPRFWVVVQPTIVRLYKIAGLIALSAILIGLISFLISSVFYFFDHSWVRPMKLDAHNQKVIDTAKDLAAARTQLGKLQADRIDLEAQIEEVGRTIKSHDKYLAEVGTQADAPKTPDQWMLRHTIDETRLELDAAKGKQTPLAQKLENVKARIDEQDQIVKRIEQSPYLKALKSDKGITLAFVPNSNEAKIGTKLYSCSWGLVMCSNVGKVTGVYDGEVTDSHPHNNSVQRGRLVEIDVTDAGANDTVLFADGKPLWLF